MSDLPLRLLVLARDQSSWVQTAWGRLREDLERQPHVEIVGVATTHEPTGEQLDADIALVLGGDGAILRAVRQFHMNQLPILGVNLGRLGFLADVSPEDFCDRLSCIVEQEWKIVHHLMLECHHHHADGNCETHLTLNEVVIGSGSSLSMLDIQLSIDGQTATTYSGDGLIVSTPVGSTAHSLSAGGPILKQDLDAVVITPICPHTLSNRPIVDHADLTYELRVLDPPDGAILVVDGQIKVPFLDGDWIEIRKAPVTFQLIRLPGHSYYDTLHRKLGWAGQPRYRRLRRPGP